jgi:hypothetical protein
VLIIPCAWGSQLTGYNHHHQLHASHQVFPGTIVGEEKEDLCMGSFSHAHPLLCFIVLLCFIYFYLHHFIENPKKLESLIVVFTCLLLVLLKWLLLKTPSCVTLLA